MERKDGIDGFGAAALAGFALLFALNQVSIKVTNGGFQPVFLAALRSAIAIPCILGWMKLRGLSLRPAPGTWVAGLLVGCVFSAEFICLYLALDLTTVARSSVIFYSMPVWLALAAHFLLPGERLTPLKATGLALAFAGVAWAILDRKTASGEASLAGDLFALGAALGWGGIALCVRVTALSRVRPEMQLLWQVVVSLPVLLLAAPFFGPLTREPGALHVAGLMFQAVVVVTFGFIGWLAMLQRYPASSVASFSFLTPVVGVALGWALLGEEVPTTVLGALALVAVGLVLINRPAKRRT
ncbi:MAG: DMT family transporter [Paracoccaceae bacterium]|nr:DMT family transporter [Paracoccaceae bacterium]